MSYFRRSRNGCKTCKKKRLKCDEKRPACANCERKQTQCEGYEVTFRWANEVGQRGVHIFQSQSQSQSSLVAPKQRMFNSGESTIMNMNSNLHRTPRLLPDAHPQDTFLFSHFLSGLTELIIVQGKKPAPRTSMLLSSALNTSSPVYKMVLATSAAHLYSVGVVSESEARKRKHAAFQGLRKAISSQQQDKNTTGVEDPGNLSGDISDETISASIMLVGIECIQGTSTTHIIPLLRGTAALISTRQKQRSQHRKTVDKSHLSYLDSSKRSTAYFDILSCIPGSRPPLLSAEDWLSTSEEEGEADLDPLMGCFSSVIATLGESSRLIHSYYSGNISNSDFFTSQKLFQNELLNWWPSYSQRRKNIGNEKDETNNSRHAGDAHRLATLIYLLRSTDFDLRSTQISPLVHMLRASIAMVPFSSPSSAAMIWPVFVLGCETYAEQDSERKAISAWFAGLLAKVMFLNIKTAMSFLEDVIWKLSDFQRFDKQTNFCVCSEWKQCEWVRYCWEQKIFLLLA